MDINNAAFNMLKIQSLLNPPTSTGQEDGQMNGHPSTVSPPLTPALTSTASTASFSPRMDALETNFPAKRQKLVEGEVKIKVNYPPFEATEDATPLSPWFSNEIERHHRRFNIRPSGSHEDGLIGEYARFIPYSSDKKGFFGKTGREGFDGTLNHCGPAIS